ncbi:acyl-CoA dehydrogenase family protein [Actinomadura madurae]|uniref:acyl-CoA dehydrogenase family protein n=1 Tax=Actinomadura madurae TaxID=1993 RepID=UPI0020D225C6|nr:acyl-CoA dehydrogenase family protein [Actinomadura madurae]
MRREVRAFLEGAEFTPRCDSWLTGFDPAFSRRLGERGWLGMTVPRPLGGHGRGPLERFTVIEELLAAGAPVAAHWVADRQMAPALVAHGSSEQRRRFLPAIVRGECFFAIGMSEPDSGSDLASARTRARRVRDGWSLTGTKVWSSGAHRAHVILVLARTAPPGPDRRAGLSQFLVTLPDPAVTIRPIGGLAGEHHFNEVTFDEAFVPDGMLLGRPARAGGRSPRNWRTSAAAPSGCSARSR